MTCIEKAITVSIGVLKNPPQRRFLQMANPTLLAGSESRDFDGPGLEEVATLDVLEAHGLMVDV
jgi:hypothetical protein|tara:strand:- start:9196 stop:9387 length:192 start_codon:yes stop_codon:yes gene_type:complete